MSRCAHGFEQIGARQGCWACDAEATIVELRQEISTLRNELKDAQDRIQESERECEEAQADAIVKGDRLEEAWDLLDDCHALIAELPRNDRQEVDWACLRRHTAALGLKIDKHI